MASRSKGKSSKIATGRPATNWTAASLEGSAPILSVVKEAAAFAPIADLKKAACAALLILQTIQKVKENKEAYLRLGDDSSGLIAAIWCSYKKTEVPERWLSEEMRDILEDMTRTLEEICSFVQEQLSRNKAIRVIFSRADAVKINEYRENLNYAMQKFELQSHMNINDVLLQIMKKNDLLSEQILHRKEEEEVNYALENTAREARDRETAEKVEVDHVANQERWHSEQLKKIERETKDRKKELERLRAAASAVEQANQLKKADEEEIARLKRTLAAARDQRNSQARKGKNSSAEDKEEEEENWDFIVEEAASKEEENRSAGSSTVKRNHSESSKRRSETLEDSAGDDEEDLGYLKSSKMKTARRKPSSDSLREDDLQSMRSSKTRIARPNRNLSSASLGEDDLRSQARRNHSGSSKKRSVVLEDSTDDDEEDLQQLMRTALRKRSTPSLDEDDLQLMSSKIIKMALLNLSSALLRAQETQDDYTDDEDGYEPLLPRQSPKPKMCVPGAIIDSDVGNTTNTTASNVGNVTINFNTPPSRRRGMLLSNIQFLI